MSTITLADLLEFIQTLFIDSDPTTSQAIAPALAVMGGAALVQTGLGAWQAHKAGKRKVDNTAERMAMAQMAANQKKLIGRAKMREAMGGEMPGMSTAEAKLGASTAQAVEDYREMGSQAGYQDFLNKALQREQEQIANLSTQGAQYKLDRSLAVDEAIGGMQDIYGMQFRRGAQQADRQAEDIAAQKATAAQNIAGGFTTAASAGMMMAGKGKGGRGRGGSTTPLPYA